MAAISNKCIALTPDQQPDTKTAEPRHGPRMLARPSQSHGPTMQIGAQTQVKTE